MRLPDCTCRILVVCLFCSFAWSLPLRSADWLQFRGPHARGIAEHPGLPDRWSATENVAWTLDIPGRGWSSPIVVGDRLFLTTVVNTGKSEEPKKGLYFGGDRKEPPPDVHQWFVLCVDVASGRELWRQEAHRGAPPNPLHVKNSYASATPVTDGERVYAYFGNPQREAPSISTHNHSLYRGDRWMNEQDDYQALIIR